MILQILDSLLKLLICMRLQIISLYFRPQNIKNLSLRKILALKIAHVAWDIECGENVFQTVHLDAVKTISSTTFSVQLLNSSVDLNIGFFW